MIRIFALSALAAFFLGCSSTSRIIEVEYGFIDNVAERRVELTFRNSFDHTVCLLPESWPNSAGKINQASEYVFLVINEQRYPIVDFNTGYCPGDCATRVASGGKVLAFIPYSDFDIPLSMIEMPKTLEFSPIALRCNEKN